MTITAEIQDLLMNLGQEHLLPRSEFFKEEHFKQLSLQLQRYGSSIHQLRESFHAYQGVNNGIQEYEPFADYAAAEHPEDIAFGEKLISEGKVGCLILSGGEGSRLNNQEPKALFPISAVQKKTFLQLFCEKTSMASKRAGIQLPLALMTSPKNHDRIQKELQKNRRFGLAENQIDLFKQKMLPLLDPNGNLLLKAPGELLEGPDGNGGALKCFFQSGLWEKWNKLGVQYLLLIPIDNPLADPFDANLCGFHAKQKLEITIKAILRENAQEKVGILAKKQGKICVAEYFECSEQQRLAKDSKDKLIWPLANINLFCFSMNFIEKTVTNAQCTLPLHFAQKTTDFWLHSRKERGLVWKCETFLFDLLAFANRVKVLLYPRQQTYSPLKELVGETGVEAVQKALVALDQKQYFKVTGVQVKNSSFELDQAFYYPTKELIKKWKARPLPDKRYIEKDL